jgi:hypothetical protein
MQGRKPPNRNLKEPLLFLREDTDTASPRTPVPIYFIHELNDPFCRNPKCQCKRTRLAVNWLYAGVESRALLLAQVGTLEEAHVEEDGKLPPFTYTHPYRKYGDISTDALPEACEMYGHDWEETQERGVKACHLCFVRGYCPGCTLDAPPDTQPFLCTHHTKRQVQ